MCRSYCIASFNCHLTSAVICLTVGRERGLQNPREEDMERQVEFIYRGLEISKLSGQNLESVGDVYKRKREKQTPKRTALPSYLS